MLGLLPARGLAQPAAQPDETLRSDESRPWVAGVPASEQAAALELYIAGNREFTESRFAQALAKYREAIRHWDHPAIRFNMAVCLINLDQALEAKDNLERSLAFGDGPLGVEAYSQGLTYRKLLDAQLAHVKIACREPGTQVTFDGKLLFTGPGVSEQVLLPGEHHVVATKAGFQPASKTLVLVAGKLTTYELNPVELTVATTSARYWKAWKPWAVLGIGTAIAGAGALSYGAARRSFASYDREVIERCPAGCDAAMLASFPNLRDRKRRAESQQILAISLFSAGGVAVLAGVIGAIVNRPRMQLKPNHAQAIILPRSDGASVAMCWSF